MKTLSLLPAWLLLLALASAARAELVVNGSMTGDVGINVQPAPWATLFGPGVHSPPDTVAAGGLVDGSFTLAPGIPASPNGGTFLAFSASMILENDYAGQNIAGLAPGGTYTLRFYYTNVGALLPPGLPLSLQPGVMKATIAGQTFLSEPLQFEGAGLQTWKLAELTFQATQPVEHLGFQTTSDLFYGGIDGVSIVPEPGSSLLMGVALVVLCGTAVKRKRQKLRVPGAMLTRRAVSATLR
jgi:hypothetical protein